MDWYGLARLSRSLTVSLQILAAGDWSPSADTRKISLLSESPEAHTQEPPPVTVFRQLEAAIPLRI
jgi:hypothetical protein